MSEIDNKLYYSIGEVAKMFNVKTSLIRFWEKEFDILKPKRNRKGNRFFRPNDVENIKLIYYYTREKGMTLRGVKKMLKENKESSVKHFEVVDKLKDVRNKLIDLKNSIS